MATKIQRAWFIDRSRRLGIVEKEGTTTKDGYSTSWKSISEVKDLRVYAISLDNDVVKNDLDGYFTQIPNQFHECIVFKAIASGYKDPRNMTIELAQYFDQQYAIGVKSGKKYSKSSHLSSGTIKQQDF